MRSQQGLPHVSVFEGAVVRARGFDGYCLHRVTAVGYAAPAGAAAATPEPRLVLEPPLRRYVALMPGHLSSDNSLVEGRRYGQGGGRQELAAFEACLGCNGWPWAPTMAAAWRLKVAKVWAADPELLRTHGVAVLLRDLETPSREHQARQGRGGGWQGGGAGLSGQRVVFRLPPSVTQAVQRRIADGILACAALS